MYLFKLYNCRSGTEFVHQHERSGAAERDEATTEEGPRRQDVPLPGQDPLQDPLRRLDCGLGGYTHIDTFIPTCNLIFFTLQDFISGGFRFLTNPAGLYYPSPILISYFCYTRCWFSKIPQELWIFRYVKQHMY